MTNKSLLPDINQAILPRMMTNVQPRVPDTFVVVFAIVVAFVSVFDGKFTG